MSRKFRGIRIGERYFHGIFVVDLKNMGRRRIVEYVLSKTLLCLDVLLRRNRIAANSHFHRVGWRFGNFKVR